MNGSSENNSNSKLLNKKKKTRNQLKTVVEFGRKFLFHLNGDSTANISFREYFNQETGKNETRIYFLAGSQNREINIKYIDLKSNQNYDKLTGMPLFMNNSLNFSDDKQQLTKEEQLLRERKRCSFNGITSFFLDESSGRLVFSERSEIFYFDDEIPRIGNELPIEISIESKGAIDIQICPVNPNIVSYILNDNLWVQDLNTKQEIQLTNTHEPKKSGVPSYAVQEEFDRYTGYWWQPVKETNSEGMEVYRIIYEEIDDSDVDLTYISPSCENEFGYDTYRYPKAGTPNSKIHLKMIEIAFSNNSNKPPVITRKRMSRSFYELFSWFEYLSRADWVLNSQYFWATVYDRLQLKTVTVLIPVDFFVNEVDPSSEMQTSSLFDDSKSVYIINEQVSSSWINFHDKMYFLNDQHDENVFSFLSASDESGFLHLYNYKISLDPSTLEHISDGLLRTKMISKTKLTDGDWSIEFEGNVNVDETNHLVYFSAYKDPVESHLFVVDYTNPKKIKQLTQNGSSHSITMNRKCSHFLTTFSNLSNPNKTFIFEINNQQLGLDKIDVKQIAQIISRDELKPQTILDPISNELKSSYANINSLLNLNLDSFLLNTTADELAILQHIFKPPQIFSFTTDDNVKLYGMIYMPYNYEHGVKYPTVLYVYGGPKFQIVTNSYKPSKYSRFNILALLGYCVVAVDSRGSKNRGQAFETHIYKKMGTVEINDQVKGLEAAARIFNCIDMSRVGIYGWSYGGYMALMGLAQRSDIFKVAISGAPVTTWNLYDTAYTERYMGLPDEEKEAYRKGSVLEYVKTFPDDENRLLIIHGMIDENVHFAHTRKLIDALIKENKPYQLLIYPNERHGIRSSEGSIHCDTNFYSFLEQNL